VQARAKLTGLVELRCGEDRASWILKAGSPQQKAIEAALAKAKPAK